MTVKLKCAVFAVLLLAGLAGCAPSELFSSIDRHCFLADWTNHHSCVSCCCHGNCCQQPRPVMAGEVLVLGKSASVNTAAE